MEERHKGSLTPKKVERHLFVSFIANALVGSHHVFADAVGADPAG
jgi:hypothetical protein